MGALQHMFQSAQAIRFLCTSKIRQRRIPVIGPSQVLQGNYWDPLSKQEAVKQDG